MSVTSKSLQTEPGADQFTTRHPWLGNVHSISLTRSGSQMATLLPWPNHHGSPGGILRRLWAEADAFVLFLSTGAALRIVAPLLANKRTDPAVVCVDEAGRYAVALLGGHRPDVCANDLAKEVAAILGAEPVVTTATDSCGLVSLDDLPGFKAEGDLPRLARALLDGDPVALDNPDGWLLPEPLVDHIGDPDPAHPVARLAVSDREPGPTPGEQMPSVILRPASFAVGVGTSLGAPAADLARLVDDTLRRAGLCPTSVAVVATIDRRASEPAVTELAQHLSSELRTFCAEQLAQIPVPSPSRAVLEAVGTPSVAEAAALLAAGPGAQLVVTKQANATTTCAVARRDPKRSPHQGGSIAVVGLGPGSVAHRTPAAAAAVRHADAVVGYRAYIEQCADLISVRQKVISLDLGQELNRARTALDLAATGWRVALVCSGDAGVYGMASPLLELATQQTHGVSRLASPIEVEVIPGVTAATAAAAIVGAPLGHDHAVISLSDLLTPWEVIESRVRASAQADMVVVFYNPRSARRNWQLARACDVLLEHRAPSTPAAVVDSASRPAQRSVLTTLAELAHMELGMTSIVVVGCSTTRHANGRMITPRGYLS